RHLSPVRRLAPGLPGKRPAGLLRVLPVLRGAPAGPPAAPARLDPPYGGALRRERRRQCPEREAPRHRAAGAAPGRGGDREFRAGGGAAGPAAGTGMIDLSLLTDGGV